jgi:hypothetical protein
MLPFFAVAILSKDRRNCEERSGGVAAEAKEGGSAKAAAADRGPQN